LLTIRGTVAGTDSKAILNITVTGEKNYAQNPGFETGKFAPWAIDGDANAVDISSETQNLHKGSYALHYWLDKPFALTLSQSITGLADGTYTLSAWIQGGGGEKTLQLFISDYGGDKLTVDIVTDGWLHWKHPAIENIHITSGKCTIGLEVASGGGSWAFFDEVELVQAAKS
jgi:arabinogalactan endo-1,4-beta-galactosidase